MHIGRTLFAADGEQVSFMTDWMPRVGDHGVFTVELITVLSGKFSVAVFEKNTEESGPGTSAGTIISNTTSTGLHPATITNLKELVRYRITVEGNGATGFVLYRILPPTWFDTAKA